MMRNSIGLLAALLISGPANACVCIARAEAEVLQSSIPRASQIVRVKILSSTKVEERTNYGPETITLYRAQLLESIKPAGSSGGAIEIRSATAFDCEIDLDIGEEWLLFIKPDGYLESLCAPHRLLGDASQRRQPSYGLFKGPFDEKYYMEAARALAEVRRLARQPIELSPASSSEQRR